MSDIHDEVKGSAQFPLALILNATCTFPLFGSYAVALNQTFALFVPSVQVTISLASADIDVITGGSIPESRAYVYF